MPVLVTGALGNTGQYIVKTLLNCGLEIIATDLKNKKTIKALRAIKNHNLYVEWADLTNYETLKQIFLKYKIEGIIHSAFIIPPLTEAEPVKCKKINIESCSNLIKLSEIYSPNIPFIFTSSTTVFGPTKCVEDLVDINHPTIATSNYTLHKIICENLLRNSSLSWCILRCSAIMNPKFHPNKETVKFGLNISLDTPLEPVHVEDVALAIKNALFNDIARKKIFIISGGKQNRITYKDYVISNLTSTLGKISESLIPWNDFFKKKYYLHWYNSEESNQILNYQTKKIDDFITNTYALMPLWQKVIAYFFKSG